MRQSGFLVLVILLISCGSESSGVGPNIGDQDKGVVFEFEVGNPDGVAKDLVVDPGAQTDQGLPIDLTAPTDTPQTEDIEGGCEEGTGCFGEPCDDNSDCLTGICVMHMGERVCSQPCVEDCPEGWRCLAVDTGSADPLFACVSNFSHLCQPCKEGSNCAGLAGPNVCVDYGVEGAFCGAVCDDEQPCPEGYLCEIASSIDGGQSRQCVNAAGVCECTDTAAAMVLAGTCTINNEFGNCTGVRVCSEDGLSDCDASTPGEEVCNGVDDDCDGLIDEVFCDDGDSCTLDQCLGEGGCVFNPINGGVCDDGDHCTELDTCVEGVCHGTQIECNDNDECTDESCDSQNGCTVTGFNEAPCDDADDCTLNDQCANGVCMPGTPLDCEDLQDCTVDSCGPDGHCLHEPAEGNCDDGNHCTTGDTCWDGECLPSGNLDCDDDEICTSDGCNFETGCIHTPLNAICDDDEICTTFDSCINGSCAGAGNLDCDDDNKCTTDSCEPGLGCLHQAFAPCCGNGIVEEGEDCDDANNTNDDECNNFCLDHEIPSVCDNLGPLATPTHSSGGTSTPYLPFQMNNGLTEDDNCVHWSWINNDEIATGGWFMFEWTTPQTVGGFVVDTVNYAGSYDSCASGGSPPGRNLLSGQVQIWSDGAWQTVASWSEELDDFKVSINPPVNTTKLRLYDINTSPGNGNSILFEWFVYDSPLCLP